MNQASGVFAAILFCAALWWLFYGDFGGRQESNPEGLEPANVGDNKSLREGSKIIEQSFAYCASGDLLPGTGARVILTDILIEDLTFPIKDAPAYINSQVYNYGGSRKKDDPDFFGRPQCHPENYSYPWQDNFCEIRSDPEYNPSNPFCEDKLVHVGVDLRPSSCEENKHEVVAVTSGTITKIGDYTVSLQDNAGRVFRYMHMEKSLLQVEENDKVEDGEVIGFVSNISSGLTTIHLHFEIIQNIKLRRDGPSLFKPIPPYPSLLNSYRTMIGHEGQLVVDAKLCELRDLGAAGKS